jgi:peptide deformylase
MDTTKIAQNLAPAEIVKVGHPVLHQNALPVSPATRETVACSEFIEILRRTLHGRGVGLAAPQIGVGLRVFVMEDEEQRVETDRDREKKERIAFPFEVVINPVWRPASQEMRTFPEGCLSIPGFQAEIARFRTIDAEWTLPDGKTKRQTLQGWPARIFQHESDHLDGRLYLDFLEDRPAVSYFKIGEGLPETFLRRLGL